MLYDKILNLCATAGTTPSNLERKCGFSPGTIIKWNHSIPRADRLVAVASALGTTSEELLREEAEQEAACSGR